MKKTFSLDQTFKTSDLNADLIMIQYKLDKMAKIMEIKYMNPKLKPSEIVKDWKISSSTKQRYRREIIMLSPCKRPPSSNINHTTKQKTPNTNPDDFKMTSNDLTMTSNELKTTSNEPVECLKKYFGRWWNF